MGPRVGIAAGDGETGGVAERLTSDHGEDGCSLVVVGLVEDSGVRESRKGKSCGDSLHG